MGWNRGSCDVPTLRDYAAAKAFYDRVQPWRGQGQYCRPLDTSRKKTFITISHLDYSHVPRVECRLYSTDVVTYYGDGSLRIETDSRSLTDSFAAQLLADTMGVECSMNTPIGSIVWVRHVDDNDWRGYPASVIYIDPCGDGLWKVNEQASKLGEITNYYLEEEVGREALKSHPNYRLYALWRKAADAMGQKLKAGTGRHDYGTREAVDRLDAGGEFFEELANDGWDTEQLRLAIYKEHDAVTTEVMPYLNGEHHTMSRSWDLHQRLKAWETRNAKWRALKWMR